MTVACNKLGDDKPSNYSISFYLS